ncbi:hypothetical protein I350_01073 [Cryptococcus amylolentus CBS 6273]|uniref:Uncharacterized protein n=1 Tax=Cryptococcus amylolentus CBS 6273 TaxID=1296118 RepID=A0A1E3KBI0_9TREE|nr:hypothetical protein I350_01073 [Cryptococcus amylolentus CBS 6273]
MTDHQQPQSVLISVTPSATDRTSALFPGTDVHNSEYTDDERPWEIMDVTIKGDNGEAVEVKVDEHYWVSKECEQEAEAYYADVYCVEPSQITIKRKSRFQPDNKSTGGWMSWDYGADGTIMRQQDTEWSRLCGCEDGTCLMRCVPISNGEQTIMDLNEEIKEKMHEEHEGF